LDRFVHSLNAEHVVEIGIQVRKRRHNRSPNERPVVVIWSLA
jgi:hypothetical protein